MNEIFLVVFIVLCFMFLIMLFLVGVLLQKIGKLETLLHESPISGILNKRGVEKQGRFLTERWLRKGETKIAAVFIDMDGFKCLNDTRGHKVGDEALRIIAETLKNCMRGEDIVGHISGDEFVIVMEYSESCSINKLIQRIEDHLQPKLDKYDLGYTTGVAIKDNEVNFDLTHLIHLADLDMNGEKIRRGKRR